MIIAIHRCINAHSSARTFPVLLKDYCNTRLCFTRRAEEINNERRKRIEQIIKRKENQKCLVKADRVHQPMVYPVRNIVVITQSGVARSTAIMEL